MAECSLRHLTRKYSPVRMCGRYVLKLVFLVFAVFVVLNALYALPFTSESASLLVARSAAEELTYKDIRLPRAALAEQVAPVQPTPAPAPKPGENVLKIKSTLAAKPAKQVPTQKPTLTAKPVVKHKVDDICAMYKLSSKIKRTIEINILGAHTLPSEKRDVTMVTQLDASRIGRLFEMANLWKWPMSVSVYVREQVVDKYRHTLAEAFVNRTNVAIHLVINTNTYYPVNVLRNIALENANTTYVFLNDVDFIPMPNIEEKLRKHLDDQRENLAKRQLFVVAAFEHIHSGLKMPESKKELIAMWQGNKTVRPVHFNTVKGEFVPNHGQGATNYNLWMARSEPYKITFHKYYEPYIIMEKSQVVKYDNTFVGRYFDKSSQVMELHAKGFQFVGLPDVYTVHFWHTNSPFYPIIYKCAYANHEHFKMYLRQRYKLYI